MVGWQAGTVDTEWPTLELPGSRMGRELPHRIHLFAFSVCVACLDRAIS